MVEVRASNLSVAIATMANHPTMALTDLADEWADIDVVRQMVEIMP